jgi:hypothetical protein
MVHMKRGEFFEEDEPVEEIVAAFSAGPELVTAALPEGPPRGWTRSFKVRGEVSSRNISVSSSARVCVR